MQKKIYKHTVLLFFIAILSSCGVSKDIETPETELPANYRNANEKDTLSIGAIEWKNFFTEKTVQHLIENAIAKNYDLQIALKNIEASQLQLKQAKWEYVPDVMLNITANSTNSSENSINGLSSSQFLGQRHIEDYNANLSVSWEADIWGKIRNQKKSALAAYLQTTEARKAIQTDIVSRVSQGFYNLLMLDAQLAIAHKNLDLNNRTLLAIQLQRDAGQVTTLAVQQAEIQRLASEQLIPLLEQNIIVQENALSILTGTLPAKTERNTTLDLVIIPKNLSAGIPSEMVRLRPDVKSHELDLVMANAKVGITKANLYPSLRITAGSGVNSFDFNNWFSIPASVFGTIAGGITQPLLQRRNLKTNYEIAKVEREKIVLQFRQSVLVAVGEVSDALVKIEKVKSRKNIATTRVVTLEQAVTNATILFNSDMADYLEVITVQSNALEGELELASIQREEMNAMVELYRSLGGGWK